MRPTNEMTQAELLRESNGICDNIIQKGLNVNTDTDDIEVRRYHELHNQITINQMTGVK